MMTKEKRIEILKRLEGGVVNFDEKTIRDVSKQVIEVGMDAFDAISNGLMKGMEKVSQLYNDQTYFIPEVLACSDALHVGLEILKPYIKREKRKAESSVVIGTVEGDIHDIGKNILKILLEANGFIVHDLGRDVPAKRFVEELRKTNSKIACLSAMVSTSMMFGMRKTIDIIRYSIPDVKIIIGGAAVSQEIKDKFGADGYSDNAVDAVKMIKNLK